MVPDQDDPDEKTLPMLYAVAETLADIKKIV